MNAALIIAAIIAADAGSATAQSVYADLHHGIRTELQLTARELISKYGVPLSKKTTVNVVRPRHKKHYKNPHANLTSKKLMVVIKERWVWMFDDGGRVLAVFLLIKQYKKGSQNRVLQIVSVDKRGAL
jgi:hypothetical protein